MMESQRHSNLSRVIETDSIDQYHWLTSSVKQGREVLRVLLCHRKGSNSAPFLSAQTGLLA